MGWDKANEICRLCLTKVERERSSTYADAQCTVRFKGNSTASSVGPFSKVMDFPDE